MLDNQIIISVEGKTIFYPGHIYRFYLDSLTLADNMLRIWDDEICNPINVSNDLVKKV